MELQQNMYDGKQLSIFDIFAELEKPKETMTPKQYREEMAKRINAMAKWECKTALAKMLASLFCNPPDMSLMTRYDVEEDFQELMRMIKTQTWHYFSLATDDAIYSVESRENSYTVFYRIGDQTMMQHGCY